jgi:hypothetical protein
MKDFQDIERVYLREKRPYWALHNAKGKRVSCTSDDIMKMTDKEARLSESFKFLETVLDDEGDGVYKIYLRTSENAGKGQIEQVFQYGEDVEPIPTTTRSNDRAREPKAAGLGALGSIGGLEFIMGLTNQGRSEADRLREEKHELQIKNLKYEMTIAGLEAQVNAPAASDNGWSDIIKGVVQEHSDLILDRFLPEAEGRTKIAALKSKRPIEVPKKKAKTAMTQRDGDASAKKGADTEGGKTENQKRLLVVFENLAQTFPDDNPIVTLERLPEVFADIDDLFPDEDPITVIEVALEMMRSKQGKAMIVPMVQSKLKKLARLAEAEDDNDDDDDDDEEGDGDDD